MFKYASFILFLETLGYKNVYLNKPMNKANWDSPHISIFQCLDDPHLPKEIILTVYANSTLLLTPLLITWTKMVECAEIDVFNYHTYKDAQARLSYLAERR